MQDEMPIKGSSDQAIKSINTYIQIALLHALENFVDTNPLGTMLGSILSGSVHFLCLLIHKLFT